MREGRTSSVRVLITAFTGVLVNVESGVAFGYDLTPSKERTLSCHQNVSQNYIRAYRTRTEVERQSIPYT